MATSITTALESSAADGYISLFKTGKQHLDGNKGKFNILCTLLSITIYGILIWQTIEGEEKNDQKKKDTSLGFLITFSILAVMLKLTGFDIYVNNDDQYLTYWLKFTTVTLGAVPYTAFEIFRILAQILIYSTPKGSAKVNSLEKEQDSNFNTAGIAISVAVYGLLIGYLASGINKNDKQQIRETAGVLGTFTLLGSIAAFANFDIYLNSNSRYLPKILYPIILGITWVPYFIFKLLIGLGNNLVGNPKKPSVESMSLDKLGKEYSGGMSRFKGNLGKRDSGFVILNKIKIAKREGILPCNPYKGVCKVRRSVIYMIFYLAAIILVPLFITLIEMEGGDKTFKLQTFMGYTSAFLAATLGLVLVFGLSTIRDAAGSDVFTGSTVEKNIREQSEVTAAPVTAAAAPVTAAPAPAATPLP